MYAGIVAKNGTLADPVGLRILHKKLPLTVMMTVVKSGTHVIFSSKLIKDFKNNTASDQFGVPGEIEAVKVKIRPTGSDFGVGRGRPIKSIYSASGS